MSDLTQETEHAALALARMVEQFQTADNLRALLTAFIAPLQEIDDAVWQLYMERWPAVATGINLDVLGAIVGQAREGRDDTTYRLWIQARVYVNRSTGAADDTLRVLQLIASGSTVTLTEYAPAAYKVEVLGLTPDPTSVWQILRLVKPAGVRMSFAYSPFAPANLFTFAPGSTLVSGNSAQGFGDATTPATGGHLAGLL